MHEIIAPIGAKTDRFAALRSYGGEKQHHESKNPSKSNTSVGYKGADKATNLSIISLFGGEIEEKPNADSIIQTVLHRSC